MGWLINTGNNCSLVSNCWTLYVYRDRLQVYTCLLTAEGRVGYWCCLIGQPHNNQVQEKQDGAISTLCEQETLRHIQAQAQAHTYTTQFDNSNKEEKLQVIGLCYIDFEQINARQDNRYQIITNEKVFWME